MPTKEIVTLERPSVVHKESFLEALLEFQAEKLPWILDLNHEELNRNFDRFVEAELNKRTLWTELPHVPEIEYWAILENQYVGRVSVRPQLNDTLRIMGGNIGYDTRPSFRGRGIASSMLKQVLPIAKSLGVEEALLTCNDNNLPSIRVIEKNGGVLRERKLQSPTGPMKRYYWIRT